MTVMSYLKLLFKLYNKIIDNLILSEYVLKYIDSSWILRKRKNNEKPLC